MAERLRSGEHVENLIIEQHVGLALSIGMQFAKGMPYYREELRSVALEALVDYTHKAKSKLYNNKITPFLTTGIKARLLRACVESPVIRVPQSMKGAKGGSFEVQLLMDEHLGRNDPASLEMQETIDQLIQNPRDKVIIDMRLSGYTDAEIGREIKLDASVIAKIRKAMFRSYHETR